MSDFSFLEREKEKKFSFDLYIKEIICKMICRNLWGIVFFDNV